MNLGNFELEVIQEQYAYLDSSWRRENVCDPFTRLYYVRKGSGYLRYEGKEIKMTSGNVYIVPAELNFDYGCKDGETMEKIFFHISIMTVENYDVLSRTKGIYKLSFAEAGCEDIFDTYDKEDYVSMLRVKMMIYRTVSSFFDKFDFEVMPLNKYSDIVKNTMKYVSKNTKITLNVSEIAKEMFISQSKLRNTFKMETGITLGKYIDDMVFYRAKRLLGNKKLSMGEISTRLGFCDQFYFSRRFKEKYGRTPTEYRREIVV